MTARYPLVLNGTTIEEVQSADTLTGLTSGNAILAGDSSGGIKNVSLSGDISFDGNTLTVSAAAFPAGTAMLFVQAAAPTGWTKSTTHNDKALRIVSGSGGGSGGSEAFTTAFANGNAGVTTLSLSQIPSHNHSGPYSGSYMTGAVAFATWSFSPSDGRGLTSSTSFSANLPLTVTANGGGGSHTHSLSLGVQYVDAIIAIKN